MKRLRIPLSRERNHLFWVDHDWTKANFSSDLVILKKVRRHISQSKGFEVICEAENGVIALLVMLGESNSDFGSEFLIGWFYKKTSIIKDDGGNMRVTALELANVRFPSLVEIGVDPGERGSRSQQQFLGPPAVWTPVGSVYHYRHRGSPSFLFFRKQPVRKGVVVRRLANAQFSKTA